MTSLLTPTATLEPTTPRDTESPLVRQKSPRLVSLDAYRGAIMLLMASSGLALPDVAKNFPDDPTWQFLAFHTEHVPWVGCSLWDLIQPSFMFMVGVALPYSIASRRAKGDSERKIIVHVFYRAVELVLLAILITSNWSKQTDFIFTNVLAQIGLGYVFLYPLLGRSLRVQIGALAAVLIGYWLLFALWPLPESAAWSAHWNLHTNPAAEFDRWFLNLFPRGIPYTINKGGYQTLNFVPSLGTMILGLMAGELLRSPTNKWHKLGWLLAAGAVCLSLGLAAGFVCPIVKRIWTPSWVLFSGGWTFAMLAGFYWIIDIHGWKKWAFPLVVVGMNSIAMYCMSQMLRGWVRSTLQIHIAPWAVPSLDRIGKPSLALFNVNIDPIWVNNTYGPIAQSAAILLVLWLICLRMYRRGVFLRL